MPATQTTSRTPIASIVGISAVATLFLLWLVYVHPPSQEFATRLLFLPALNALFNAMKRHRAGYRILLHPQAQHRRSSCLDDDGLRLLVSVSRLLHHQPCAAWRDALFGPRSDSDRISRAADQPYTAVCHRATYGADHIFLLINWSVSTT